MPTVRNFRSKRRRPSNANPVVSYLNSSLPSGTYGIDSQISILLQANCSLIVSGQPAITLNTTPPCDAVYSSGSGTQQLTFLVTPPGGTVVNNLDVASSSALTGGTIVSALASVLTRTMPTGGNANSLASHTDLNIDCIRPYIISVTAVSNGPFIEGEYVDIDVLFSEVVTVRTTKGVPYILLDLSPSRQANYLSGTGTNTIRFRYQVVADDVANPLEYVDINSLVTNALAGQINMLDAAGNQIDQRLPVPGEVGSLSDTSAVVVDATTGGGSPTTYLLDNFNGTSGTSLSGRSPDIGSAPSYINGPQQLNGSGSVTFSGGTDIQWDLPSADADFTVTFTSVGTAYDATVRFNIVDANNYMYVMWLIWDGGYTLHKVVSGTDTQIGSTYTQSWASNATHNIRVRTEGDNVKAWHDSTQIFDETISSRPGKTAVRFGTHCGSADTLDYVEAVSLAGGGSGTATSLTNIDITDGAGTYNQGDTLHFEFTFSDTVSFTGAPRFILNTSPERYGTITGGSGTSTLTGTWTVRVGDQSSALDVTSISLSGGTIRNGSVNSTLTVPSAGDPGSLSDNTAVVIDGGTNPILPVISTSHDNVPNFGYSATKTSAGTGYWDVAGTWTPSGVPGNGDVVNIANGHTVTIRTQLSTRPTTVSVLSGGKLTFDYSADTRLYVQNLMVLSGGELEAGTASNPISSSKTCEIIYIDEAMDADRDPEQYGNGGLFYGKVTMHGAVKTPWGRLGAEVSAGATSLTAVSGPSGWQANDWVVVPDSRQLDSSGIGTSYTSRTELRQVSSVSSTTINLASAMTYAHGGARASDDNSLDYLPHVGNVSRNLIIRSENGSGVRGHNICFNRADIDVRYVEFRQLGRTDNELLDGVVTYASDGSVATYPATQRGRYAWHFHHVFGPVSPQNNGRQGTLYGCSFWDSTYGQSKHKWPLTAHDSSYLLLQWNVIVHPAGSGIAFEEGTEIENQVYDNFVCGSDGMTNPRNLDGRVGDGLWFAGYRNYFDRNVAAANNGRFLGIIASCGFSFVMDSAMAYGIKQPLYQGADTHDGDEGVEWEYVNAQRQAMLSFDGNESYCSRTGMTVWHLGCTGYEDVAPTVDETLVQDFVAWHFVDEGFFGYPHNNMRFLRMVTRGTVPVDVGSWPGITSTNDKTAWRNGDYKLFGTTFEDCDFQGCYHGIGQNFDCVGTVAITGCHFCNYMDNILIDDKSTPGANADAGDSTITITDCTYSAFPTGPGLCTIRMWWKEPTVLTYRRSFSHLNRVRVVNHAGTTSDYRLYFAEQDEYYVMPQTVRWGQSIWPPDGRILCEGSPDSGKTNAQNWADNAVAMAGAVAPSVGSRITVSNIDGIVGAYS